MSYFVLRNQDPLRGSQEGKGYGGVQHLSTTEALLSCLPPTIGYCFDIIQLSKATET